MGNTKLKTYKAASKRLVITKSGKVLKRVAGQDHFNARERGLTSMNKRRDIELSPVRAKSVKKLLPYH